MFRNFNLIHLLACSEISLSIKEKEVERSSGNGQT